MYQGEAVSVFPRAYEVTNRRASLRAATLAVRDLDRPVADGGTTASIAHGPWPEEYAGPHPTSVLNRGLTAMFGDLEYHAFTGRKQPMLARHLSTLGRMLPSLTEPGWAKYQLAGNDMVSLMHMPIQTDELLILASETGDVTALHYGEMWLADFSGEGAIRTATLRAENGIVPSGMVMSKGLPPMLPPGRWAARP